MPIPKRDQIGLTKLTKYLETPRSAEEIGARFGISRRTVSRWLDYLRQDGLDVLSRKTPDGTRRHFLLKNN